MSFVIFISCIFCIGINALSLKSIDFTTKTTRENDLLLGKADGTLNNSNSTHIPVSINQTNSEKTINVEINYDNSSSASEKSEASYKQLRINGKDVPKIPQNYAINSKFNVTLADKINENDQVIKDDLSKPQKTNKSTRYIKEEFNPVDANKKSLLNNSKVSLNELAVSKNEINGTSYNFPITTNGGNENEYPISNSSVSDHRSESNSPEFDEEMIARIVEKVLRKTKRIYQKAKHTNLRERKDKYGMYVPIHTEDEPPIQLELHRESDLQKKDDLVRDG